MPLLLRADDAAIPVKGLSFPGAAAPGNDDCAAASIPEVFAALLLRELPCKGEPEKPITGSPGCAAAGGKKELKKDCNAGLFFRFAEEFSPVSEKFDPSFRTSSIPPAPMDDNFVFPMKYCSFVPLLLEFKIHLFPHSAVKLVSGGQDQHKKNGNSPVVIFQRNGDISPSDRTPVVPFFAYAIPCHLIQGSAYFLRILQMLQLLPEGSRQETFGA
jgi:hypothetical protein